MRKICLFAVLLLSTAGISIAQNPQEKPLEALSAAVQRRQISFVSESHQIVILLENSNRVIIGLERNDHLLRFRNADSLLAIFMKDFAQVKDTLQVSTASFKALYRLEKGQRNLRFWHYPAPHTQIQFADDENLLVKTQQDTVVIEQVFTETKPLTAAEIRQNARRKNQQVASNVTGTFRIYLFVNSVSDLQKIADSKLNPKVEKVIGDMRAYPKADLFGPKIWAFHANYTNASTPVVFNRNKAVSPDGIIIAPHFGLGVVGNAFVPNIGANIVLLHRSGLQSGLQSGLLLAWDRHFAFGRDADGGLTVQPNDFVSIGVAKLSKHSEPPFRQTTELKLGYLIRRRGEFFAENTFRISVTFSPYASNKEWQRLRIEPELYFNGFFKKVYPGLRLTMGF